MKNRQLLYLISGILVFTGLVYFNMSKARQAIKEEQPAPLSISVVSHPSSLKKEEFGKFEWNVTATSDLSTKFTTIYWAYESSPSALPKDIAPDTSRYANYDGDYTSGSFKLPDNFDLNLKFPHIGTVYFRAYALVGKDHLWSNESSLVITP